MKDLIALKVKIKSLAVEARIIRKEERKAKLQFIRNHLQNHRRYNVRDEARWSQLAYGFLRGLEYSQMEAKNSTDVNWTRVTKLVEKFGETVFWGEEYESRKDYEIRLKQQRITLQKWIEIAQLYRAGHAGSKKDSG